MARAAVGGAGPSAAESRPRGARRPAERSRRSSRPRSWSGRVRLTLATMGLAAAPALAGATTVLFGVTFRTPVDPVAESLIRLDLSTGAAAVVGPLDADMRPFGLGTRDGRLYTYDSLADRVREIDPTTGATLGTIDIGTGDLIGEGGLEFRGDGTGFLSESRGATGQLWSFDVTTGSSTPITAMGGLVPSLDGLAFQPGTDALFGLSQTSFLLYTVDLATGATTLVGPTGITGSSPVAGLAFSPDGSLYAATVGSLYTLDPSTGRATLVGATGFATVSGLAILDVEPIPEPTTVLLLGAGLLGLGRRTRHRR